MEGQENKEFKQLTKLQSALFMLGGIIMVVGMGFYVLLLVREWAAWLFLVGALVFATMQCMQVYMGADHTLRRLKSIQNLADLFFVLAGVLMIDTANHFLRPMFSNTETYLQIVYNKWLILLLIAVVLEVYTTHRITYLLKKENN